MMEEFDINKEYAVGDELYFNGIELTVVNDFNCNKCFFKSKCIDSKGFFPICCNEQRSDRQMVIFVKSNDVNNG